MRRKPLEDITICDLTWVMAGPGATRMFRDLGATVIRIENNKTLDVLRTGWQRKNNDDFYKEGGWAFQDFNRGKTDIALNLKTEGGREVLHEIVKRSDIVVANYGPRAFHKLGIDYESLRQVKEDIIVLNAAGLGDYGPYSNFITYAPSLMSIAGMMGIHGYEGARDPEMPTELADYTGCLTLANYMLAAIEYRRRTGKGQFIDVSQGEGAEVHMGQAILHCWKNAAEAGCIGNRDWRGSAAPHNTYPCRGDDEWCVIAVTTEEDWQKLCAVIDPEGTWSGAPEFRTLADRLRHLPELDSHIAAWTAERDKYEIGDLLQAAGVSAAPVQNNWELLNRDEHMKARGYFVPVDLEPDGKYPDTFRICNIPGRMSTMEYPTAFHRAPSWGEHTDEILREYLGKSDEWIKSHPVL